MAFEKIAQINIYSVSKYYSYMDDWSEIEK